MRNIKKTNDDDKKKTKKNKEDLQVSQMVQEVPLFQTLPENQKPVWSIYLH